MHPVRLAETLSRKLCQICGRPLADSSRVVIYARAVDFVHKVAPEPGMHPSCAAYSRHACPMLSAALDRYATGPRRRCGDPDCECRIWLIDEEPSPRHGQPAEAWYAAWMPLHAYRITRDPTTGVTGPSLDLSGIRRVRKVRDAAGDDPHALALDLLTMLQPLP